MRTPLAHEQTPTFLDCALERLLSQGDKVFKDGVSRGALCCGGAALCGWAIPGWL